jgi:cytochrome c oxidase subunit 1
MSAAEHTHHDEHDHGTPTGFLRWLYSTNHKDIGTMYLIFSVIAGLIGGAISMYMRMELQNPGVQYMENGHVWNVYVTAHGLIMVFFCCYAGPYRRVRQLVCAAYDRCPGHGIPSNE